MANAESETDRPSGPWRNKDVDEAPRRRSERERTPRKRPSGVRALLLFLLFGALPLAAVGWFFFQPEATREAFLAKIPEGAGGRAIKAAICLGALIALAWIALPAFRGASLWLGALLGRMRAAGTARRVLLFPIEALVGLLWLVVQMCFAVDVVLTIAAGLGLVLATARIVKPELLSGVAPWLS